MISEKDIAVIKEDFDKFKEKYNLDIRLDEQGSKIEVDAFLYAWILQDSRIKNIKSKINKLKTFQPTTKETFEMLSAFGDMKSAIEEVVSYKSMGNRDMKIKLNRVLREFNAKFDKTKRNS